MINIQRFKNLGELKLKWLHARYHFSFAHYHNPDRMGFGKLRVVNDDLIQAKSGFDTHPHQNMEIITYIRQGQLTHRDNAGHEGTLNAGDIQVMSAGSGIYHSEHNNGEVETELYQIWIEPHTQNVKPKWKMIPFPKKSNGETLTLLASGKTKDSQKNTLFLNQDAAIYGGNLNPNTTIDHPITHQIYLLVSQGELEVDGQRLKKGDACEVTEQAVVTLHTITAAEILIIDVPK